MGNNVRHLTVNGSALTSGGTFHKVTIRGDATINGDLWCDRCKVFGNADVSGNIEAKSFHIFGQANIRGNVQGETIKLFGEMNLRGNAAAAYDFHLRGAVHADGDVTGGTIHGYGEMKVSRDCEADVFSVKGAVEIGNILNADQVELYLYFADSRIFEIGGKTIRVKRSKAMNLLHFLKRFAYDSKLKAETIEGDDIYLEHTDAKVVRGDRIIIGPGCNIDLVEYHTSFQQDEKAIVKEKRKRS
ncbi:polymer-forming cytoskeletal protein [Parageobacillus sp. VR-IP]|uniref:polymer-forming cytoskeletal protein n=1 Tax=Parageobacillus sp. VR-IP TaxID=2742205 RepID=UPI00158150FC|nr:polymer-forming cytoskeletal protein [Parageobacillus sp. VR-IP]NUK29227.1 polymer-forming cytoskeletal protein [Parageobacillus sp. VR-IP]